MHWPMKYGDIQQYTPDKDASTRLDNKGVKRAQGIIGTLLYMGQAVNNKLLVTFSTIGIQHAIAT